MDTPEDKHIRFAAEQHEYRDPTVMLGLWFEERARREADAREYMHLHARGEHSMQKLDTYVKSLKKEVLSTESLDGRVTNGSIVRVGYKCCGSYLSALPNLVSPDERYTMPCLATVAPRPYKVDFPARSAIRVFRENHRVPDSIPLMHNECLLFCHAGSAQPLYLNLSSCDPMPYRKPHWSEISNSHALWKTTRTNGQGRYIEVNSPVVIHHVASGQQLSMDKTPIQTLFGSEKEAACKYDPEEPDTWRFAAPCELPCSEYRHMRNRNTWDILNELY